MKVIVLSSGGLDSTTCLGMAVEEYGKENVLSASIYYGQKHSKELICAEKVAEYYGVKHIEKDISTIMEYSNCSLLKKSTKSIKHKSYYEQISEDGEGRVETYVPFRNGLMLSVATAIADSMFPNEEVKIYYGAHADDMTGSAYADCSIEFAEAMSKAINIGTYNLIEVVAPLIKMNKTQVVAKGLELKVPYELTWSCYEGGDLQCGVCATCIDRKKAFENNGVKDPVEYM